MNQTLFDIGNEYRSIVLQMEEWAEDHDGDITDFPLKEAFEALEGSLEQKILNIALLAREERTFGESIQGEGKPFADLAADYRTRGQAKLNRAERLRNLILDHMPAGVKYENTKVSVRTQVNSVDSLEVAPDALPEEFPSACFKAPELDTDKVREVAAEVPGIVGRAVMNGSKVLARVFRGRHVRIK